MIKFLNLLIPKNSKIIYLRSRYEYRDNIHSVLDEFLKHPSSNKYKIICDGFAFDKYVSRKIRNPKRKIILLYYFLRARFVIFDTGLYGQPQPIKRQILVNTWHGVSLKKIGYHIDGYNKNSKKRLATYLTVYSEYFVENMSIAFGVPREDILVTGEPRNDQFFHKKNGIALKSLGFEKNNFEKTIIWMPTYRKHRLTKEADGNVYNYGIPFISEIETLNQILTKNSILLIVKLHGLEETIQSSDLSNIKYIDSIKLGNADTTVNELLVDCDALITDYSSVYINYLLLNKPICFAYDDMDEYVKKRGFMFNDVNSMMPGLHANNYNQLIEFINDVALGIDSYQDERKRVNSFLNKYSDGMNSLRLLQFLGLVDK